MKDLQIIIAGCTNTGKSAIMFHLQQLFLTEGFNVQCDFEGHPEYENEIEMALDMMENTKERLDAIKQGTMITLKEMQMAREPKINNSEVTQA